MNVNNQSWNCSKLRSASRIMAHDRHEGESSCPDEWRMKNMSRFCSPASHAFVLSIVHGIYAREGHANLTEQTRISSIFLLRAHIGRAAPHVLSKNLHRVKHFSKYITYLRTLPFAVRATDG